MDLERSPGPTFYSSAKADRKKSITQILCKVQVLSCIQKKLKEWAISKIHLAGSAFQDFFTRFTFTRTQKNLF